MFLRPRANVSGYFWVRNFFFPDSKISTSTRTCIQIRFARPRASDTFLDTLRYAGLLWGRRRLRKRPLKSEFVLLRTFISLIPTRSSSNVGNFFWELNFKRLYQSSGKEREGRCLVFTCLTQREIRHFHVVVVQQRQRNLQKRVMHVKSCCLNSYFFELLSHLFRLVHRQMLANFFGVEF